MKAQTTSSSIKIYIEGGGDGPAGKAALRTGFNDLLSKQRERARALRWRWDLVPCGGRNAALDAFLHESTQRNSGIIALLVDAEGAVASHTPAGRVEHLVARDGWDLRIANVAYERVHLMTQTMETWIAADPEALHTFYGQGFNSNALPKRQKLDDEDRHALSSALAVATSKTKKGSYHKIHHASALLSKVRPEKLAVRCTSFRVFTEWLDQLLVLAAPRPDAASHLCQAAPSRLAQAVGVNCQGSRTLPRSAARMAACRYAAGSLQWSLSVSSTV